MWCGLALFDLQGFITTNELEAISIHQTTWNWKLLTLPPWFQMKHPGDGSGRFPATLSDSLWADQCPVRTRTMRKRRRKKRSGGRRPAVLSSFCLVTMVDHGEGIIKYWSIMGKTGQFMANNGWSMVNWCQLWLINGESWLTSMMVHQSITMVDEFNGWRWWVVENDAWWIYAMVNEC